MRTIACFVFVTLLSVSVVHAESADAREQARQHYARGLEHIQSGAYAQGLEEFLSAYRISPNFAVLYNIGQAYVALGRPSDAATALERYLREGKDQIPAERVEQTAAQIAAQKAQTAEITISVNAPGSSISVDGKPVGRAPLAESLRLAPGAHLVSVIAAGRPEVTRSVTLHAGQRLDLQFDVPSPEETPKKPTGTLRLAPATSRAATKPAAESSKRVSTIGFVLGGVGAAVGAVAIGHYLWNRGRYDDWNDANSELTDPYAENRRQRQIDNNDLAGSIDRASRVTVSLALGSGALLATGVTLIAVDGGSPKRNGQGNGMNVALRGVW